MLRTVWTGDSSHRFAPTLLTLLNQLKKAYPGQQWVTSLQTGTIGDVTHQAENSDSDHNPWLNNTVRALDVAANVSNVPGIMTVTDAPDCEKLFATVNKMYEARDPRVFPDGYAMYLRRITDPARPGQFKATTPTQDPHLYHLHISVSTNSAGYNSTTSWPIESIESTDSGSSVKINPPALGKLGVPSMYQVIRNKVSGAIALVAPGYWAGLNYGPNPLGAADIQVLCDLPMCVNEPDSTGHKVPYSMSPDRFEMIAERVGGHS